MPKPLGNSARGDGATIDQFVAPIPPGRVPIASFPPGIQSILMDMDTNGDGTLDQKELTELFSVFKDLKESQTSGTVKISTVPKAIQPILAKFDINGDGSIRPDELAKVADLYESSRKNAQSGRCAISNFPPDTQAILNEMDDGDGTLDARELTAIFRLYRDMKESQATGTVKISSVPKDIQAVMSRFDDNGDGTINPFELAKAADLYEASKQQVRRLMKLTAGLFIMLLMTLLAIGILTYGVVEMSKETTADDSGMVFVKGTNTPTSSGQAIKTVDLFQHYKLTPDELENVKSLKISSDDGKDTFIYTVTGAKKKDAAVTYSTSSGDKIVCSASHIKVIEATTGKLLLQKDYAQARRARLLLDRYSAVAPNHRRLSAANLDGVEKRRLQRHLQSLADSQKGSASLTFTSGGGTPPEKCAEGSVLPECAQCAPEEAFVCYSGVDLTQIAYDIQTSLNMDLPELVQGAQKLMQEAEEGESTCFCAKLCEASKQFCYTSSAPEQYDPSGVPVSPEVCGGFYPNLLPEDVCTSKELPLCKGEKQEFDAGWGDCSTYAWDHEYSNHFFCKWDVDASMGLSAQQVCPECEKCDADLWTKESCVPELDLLPAGRYTDLKAPHVDPVRTAECEQACRTHAYSGCCRIDDSVHPAKCEYGSEVTSADVSDDRFRAFTIKQTYTTSTTTLGSQCSPGCLGSFIGNFECDEACNTEDCQFDGGDCVENASPSTSPAWPMPMPMPVCMETCTSAPFEEEICQLVVGDHTCGAPYISADCCEAANEYFNTFLETGTMPAEPPESCSLEENTLLSSNSELGDCVQQGVMAAMNPSAAMPSPSPLGWNSPMPAAMPSLAHALSHAIAFNLGMELPWDGTRLCPQPCLQPHPWV
eukprot:TRINITY_DN6563_c0_g1_i5.p1 TRINITY_DN6563_c0_g1~~TRINITY_DN6563_c0_g1_i5.p1  ORF type:complete len:879 (+),score=166.14 TRINITY_DN6563_c0_g1_i5:131-2767(+)